MKLQTLCVAALMLSAAWSTHAQFNPSSNPSPASTATGASSVVKIEPHGKGFRLLRTGQPFFIKGAVGWSRFELLAGCGANAVRTGADVKGLDQAQRLGLGVLVGLPVGKQRSGFDYGNAAQVQKQRDHIRQLVLKFKDHPAVLLWTLGNELELVTTPEQRVPLWKEVNALAKLVHELDPNHPVITTIGDAYRHMLHELDQYCPALDAIGLNAYADMLTMPEDVAREHWQRPYVVTEFGPRGHWQVPRTAWGARLEDSSTQKAEFYQKAYLHAVQGQPQCLGAFTFLWGQKMEKTHTWYGMFLEDGSPTEAVDVMTFVWSGHWPANRAPRIAGLQTEPDTSANQGQTGEYAVGTKLRCTVEATDPEGGKLSVGWDLRADVADNPSTGGDWEPAVKPIEGAVLQTTDNRAVVQLPAQPGKYRLFVYVRDGQGSAATANVPLLLK
ncbi:MAG TPA: glycoside hydrolase family 2 TIM barrel-domain containing protein [Candidatus Sulfotelmatobacter sp.]|nr:glycoside hydrolase family 2 TIM barrel-domain containing protein [Candidatus Sulfotelmatobacter sp.]